MSLGLNDIGGIVRLAWRIWNVGSSQYTSARMRISLIHVVNAS